MSRELRPVPLDWEHPRDGSRTYTDGSPRYIPLHSREFLRTMVRERDEHPDDPDYEIDLDEYMPEIPEGTLLGWQMYETVSEGSPVSPVFATKNELAAWLASPAAGREQVPLASAQAFVADEWAPSGMTIGGQFMSGVEAAGRQAG